MGSPLNDHPCLSLVERALTILGGATLAAHGMRNRSLLGCAATALGAALAIGAATGSRVAHRTGESNEGPETQAGRVHLRESISIAAPPAEVYARWRPLEDLPQLLPHVRSIDVVDDRLSRWTIAGPGGATIEWLAEISSDIEDRRIGWHTVGHGDIKHAGTIRFEPTDGGTGTRMTVTLNYDAPGGPIGRTILGLFASDPSALVSEALQSFKDAVEQGGAGVAPAAGSEGGNIP